jgi:hypothetical protein
LAARVAAQRLVDRGKLRVQRVDHRKRRGRPIFCVSALG